jgi:hypothetical protein
MKATTLEVHTVEAGATSLSARIAEPSAPAPLAKSEWLPAADLSAGATWYFGSLDGANGPLLRVGVSAEGGYGMVPFDASHRRD